jgi:zinc protease
MMDIEADRMANLLLAPESFEKERAVILEERKYRYENSAQGQLFQKMIEEVYVDTPYGVPTIGTIEDIKSVTRDQMMDYFKTFYAPNAAILVVVGDVNANEVLKLAEEKMGQLPRSKVYDQVVEKKDAPYLFHHRAEYGRHVKVQGESPDPIFALAFKGEPMGSQKSYVLDMLASLLGAGKSSYLTQEFVFHEKPQATSIYAYNYNLKNNGIFMIGGQLMPKINIDRFESDLKKKLIQSCEVAMTERSLQKSKNQFILSYFNQLESNAGLASFIGDREAYLNDFMSYQKEIEIYQKMDSKILIQTCREIFSEKALMISVWEKYPKEKKK